MLPTWQILFPATAPCAKAASASHTTYTSLPPSRPRANQFSQIHVPPTAVGDAKNYLLENMTANVVSHEGSVLFIELPASVELTITYTEPGIQGDRSTGGNKPATLETGATVQVPLFITQGEKIKVDTRDGRYLGRAS